ncbi:MULTISPECIES: hypothetical protein [unclassified Archaeoglobus]|jgi:hypothetical protein|uniref:hypothetical protein n=1 Tax=unclassified Archaeoglobus TaxID=2643606 RepID=UPI0025BF0ADF|nr:MULTISPECIES: hypothetical protein [unclassified Archaeoglobus]
MGLFDKIKRGIESIAAHAKMDDFLIAEIDRIMSERWEKVSEKRPTSIAGISLEEEAEYNFTYRTPSGIVKVEMEHEFPYVEIEIVAGGRKIERKIKVADFVEKKGAELKLRNREELERLVNLLIDSI